MLGDIHKFQYLNDEKTVAYSGSLIKQSYGESINNHGILKWDLLESESNLIEIPNDYGFCTVKIKNGVMEESFISRKPRIRFILEDTTQMQYQDILSGIEKKYDIQEIIKDSRFRFTGNSLNKKNSEEMKKLSNISSQENIILTYLKNKNLSKEKIDKIINLHKKIYQKILQDKKDQVGDIMHGLKKNTKWKILKLNFSNTLSYGDDNEIDFTKFEPNKVIGIFAPNHYGKSAILDIILFCLFDKFSRGLRRDFLNKNKNKMFCSLLFSIGNTKYLIERIGERNRNGVDVTIKVNFFSIKIENSTEIKEKLNGSDIKKNQQKNSGFNR